MRLGRLLSILDKLQTTIEALSLIRQFFGLVMNGNLGNILSNSLAILKDPQSFGSTDDFNIQEIIESLSKNQGAIATAAFKSWYQWSRSNWNRIRGYGVNMPTPIGTPINQKIQLPEKFHLGGKPLFLILGGRTGGTITGLSVVARLAGGDVKNIWRMDFHRWTPGHPIGGNKKELNAWRDGKFHFHVMRPPQ